MPTEKQEPTIEEVLLSTTGLPTTELDNIMRLLRPLEARLKSYRPGSVELHLVAKDFDTRQQKLTLEARIDGHGTLVATSHHMELQKAIKEVREDLSRLMTDAITKTEPRNNRALRETDQ
jgi:ribosome-associated translation inhibitor RaiA